MIVKGFRVRGVHARLVLRVQCIAPLAHSLTSCSSWPESLILTHTEADGPPAAAAISAENAVTIEFKCKTR